MNIKSELPAQKAFFHFFPKILSITSGSCSPSFICITYIEQVLKDIIPMTNIIMIDMISPDFPKFYGITKQTEPTIEFVIAKIVDHDEDLFNCEKLLLASYISCFISWESFLRSPEAFLCLKLCFMSSISC